MIEITPPKLNELEITIFGPGFGECILIHWGNNQWAIVDSCINPKDKVCLPLNYLKSISVNTKKDVKMVVATHWHDDHIRGLSEIVNECSQSIFVCSSALLNKEFLTFVKAYDTHTKIEDTGVSEISSVIEILNSRSGRIVRAIVDRLLLNELISIGSLKYEVKVHSLSPSDEDFNQANLGLGNLLKEIVGPTRRAINIQPNNVAVVIDITVSNIKILLGSDLEVINNDKMGWNAIMKFSRIISGKFDYFKIPHHGSVTAHHEELWNKNIDSDSLCTLTPFELGRNFLPTEKDIERICSLTPNVYSTRIKENRIKRENNVEKMIKEVVGTSLKLKSFSSGFIRCRRNIDNPTKNWEIELFNDAFRLCQV